MGVRQLDRVCRLVWVVGAVGLASVVSACVELGDPPSPFLTVNNFTTESLDIEYLVDGPATVESTLILGDAAGDDRQIIFRLPPRASNSFPPRPSSEDCTVAPVVAHLSEGHVEVLRLEDPICFVEGYTWSITQEMID